MPLLVVDMQRRGSWLSCGALEGDDLDANQRIDDALADGMADLAQGVVAVLASCWVWSHPVVIPQPPRGCPVNKGDSGGTTGNRGEQPFPG